MNAELPPFENGDHSSENASTIDRVITPVLPDKSLDEYEQNGPSWVLIQPYPPVGHYCAALLIDPWKSHNGNSKRITSFVGFPLHNGR